MGKGTRAVDWLWQSGKSCAWLWEARVKPLRGFLGPLYRSVQGAASPKININIGANILDKLRSMPDDRN